MKTWYSKAAAQRMRSRYSRWSYGILIMVILSLAVCVFLSTKVRTGNAGRLLVVVAALSTAAGWAAMLLNVFVRRPAKAQAEHLQGLLEAEEETRTGTFALGKELISIPGSIDVRKLRLDTGEKRETYNLNVAFVKHLPPEGTQVRLSLRRSFVTGCEVIGREDA